MDWPGESFDIVELARAEYGIHEADLDSSEVAMLTRSYVRRKQYEARLIAVAVADMMFGSKNKRKSQARKLAPDDLMRFMANPNALD